MTHWFLAGATLLAAGLFPSETAAPESRCDLKTVVEGLYCAECDEVLDGDSLEKKEYCADCHEEAVDAKKTPKKAKKVQICVKTAVVCPDCEEPGKQGDTCEACDVKFTKVEDRARILFACEECDKEFEKAGKCDEKECREAGAKAVRTCEGSGIAPHVGG